jgi:hypothetical protein
VQEVGVLTPRTGASVAVTSQTGCAGSPLIPGTLQVIEGATCSLQQMIKVIRLRDLLLVNLQMRCTERTLSRMIITAQIRIELISSSRHSASLVLMWQVVDTSKLRSPS